MLVSPWTALRDDFFFWIRLSFVICYRRFRDCYWIVWLSNENFWGFIKFFLLGIADVGVDSLGEREWWKELRYLEVLRYLPALTQQEQ